MTTTTTTTTTTTIPFSRPFVTGAEAAYLAQAMADGGKLCGDGPFTARCQIALARLCASPTALLTHSCTAALEMAAMLLELERGDEIVMPSFTFVSTANAFALRGAVPVFVDIDPHTLNLDPAAVAAAITPRTRAIVAVHYAGVGCDMQALGALAQQHGLALVEDAAQAIGARRAGRPLGGIGDLGALSFHDTKNVVCGEGGALLVNRPELARRAEVLREKGTDRSRFLRGEVDKYSWQDIGSSFLPSDLLAAFLLAQLEREQSITAHRYALWRQYDELLRPLEAQGLLTRARVPADCEPNGHICWLLLARGVDRDAVLAAMRAAGVHATFHYVPLHDAPAGLRLARSVGPLDVTVDCAARLVRLPLYMGLSADDQVRVVDTLRDAIAAQPVPAQVAVNPSRT